MDNNIPCENTTINSIMRKAIWNHYASDLRLQEIEIEVTKEDAKAIWSNISSALPLYFLFQADRKNTDSDGEIQDPLQAAVKQVLAEPDIVKKFEEITARVYETLSDVSNRTLIKLNEMDSSVAETLTPRLPDVESLKWSDVFKKVSITGDQIPINKRGSGVKRMILLNFFRAEVEKRVENNSSTSIIYAIEEPETSQHTNNQRILINALKDLSDLANTQVIITTHSANIVKELQFNFIRMISENDSIKSVRTIQRAQLCYPSLNEINYLAFSEAAIEYHNELYGYIEENGWIKEYKNGKKLIDYIKICRDGSEESQKIPLTEFVRHRIHHPENTKNRNYTISELKESIQMMRDFIDTKQKNMLN